MKHSQRPHGPLEFEVPTIAQLAVDVEPVFPHTQVKDLLARFHDRADQPILPVLDEAGAYAGAVSRRGLLGFMTKAFAMDLFMHRTVADLLQRKPELGAVPMVARAGERLDQTMRELLQRDPNMECEALPAVDDGRVVGVVTVTDMMASLSESQARLIEVMHALSDRLNEEVAHAALLQRSLLPPSDIRLPGLRGSATLLTSTEVGGDFYDYYCVDERWAVILAGDVSGHGLAAGTLVSAAKAGVNLLAAEGVRDPGTILGRLNHAILKTAHQRLLMTLFAACLDTQTGELLYANAGHQFPYVYRFALGEMETLETGGLPLGKSPDSAYSSSSTRLEVDDRLFFYTDGILEEEDAAEEPFGYDRLERFLAGHFEQDAALLCENLLAELRQFSGKKQFQDDVTVICVEHHERRPPSRRDEPAANDDMGLVRIAESFYRANEDRLMPGVPRQNLVFLSEGRFGDLLRRLARDGIRRVLPRHHPTIARIGWKKLLAQHQPSHRDDLEIYLPRPELEREFSLGHSADKNFIIEEAEAWLAESGLAGLERLDSVAMLIDELIENGLYAAPRDGKGRPLYAKGSERILGGGESLRLRLAVQDGLLGLHMRDSWGTLTPAVFLNRLLRHAEGDGLLAGQGGAGLYLMWRLGDYLQFRVHPHQQTQVTLLLDLYAAQETEADKGFQFFYHSEIHEHLECEPSHAEHYAQAAD